MFRIIHTDPWLRGDKYRTSRTVSLMNNRSSGACGGAQPQTGSWVAAELAGPGIGDVSRQPRWHAHCIMPLDTALHMVLSSGVSHADECCCPPCTLSAVPLPTLLPRCIWLRRSNACFACHSGAVIHARADTPEDSSASPPSGPSDVLLGRLSGGELPECTLSVCLPRLQLQLPDMMGCSCSLLRQW